MFNPGVLMRRSFIQYVSLAIMISVASPLALSAQSIQPLEKGDRLRVTSTNPASMSLGILASLDNETVVLLHKPLRQDGTLLQQPPSRIPMSSVVKLEVNRGRQGVAGRTVAGTLLGILAGGVGVGMIGHRATLDCSCDDPGIGVLLAFPGGLLGGIVGGAVGYSTSRVRWESIPVPGAAPR